MIGETILHYKILEKLGEGGMGEVYKAQDTKLDRFVALKFLPSQMTASDDDKARFIQEAKAASAMNHPNVCTIHSIEEHNNQLFIVMEFVEGKTLKDKKDSLSEKQILEIGIQVAEGLAAAHEKGIVHRDIKPENIMVRKDGIAQIMDFGLAKLYKDSNVSRLTKAGITMGTMGYMSPEQVQGLDVDYRTDIFSLGIVLYELLAGESPFKGMHETAIMYEIINVDPQPISTIKEEFDPELDRIILECLEKEKDERCQSAKELAKDFRKIKKSTGQRKSRTYQVSSGGSAIANPSGSLNANSPSRSGNRFKFLNSKSISWVVSVLLLIALVSAIIILNKPSSEKIETRFAIELGKDQILNLSAHPAIALSHNGKMIVFKANDRLYLRKMNQMNPVPFAGTENAMTPFFSGDDKWLGFYTNGKLEKISLAGGTPVILADANDNRGATWNKSGKIVFSGNTHNGLSMISENGGTVKAVTFLDSSKNERTHRWPSFLPDGKNVLFTVGTISNPDYYENASIDVVNIETGERKNILRNASTAKYVSPGYLIFSRSGILYAQQFNLGKLKVKGNPVPVIEGVGGDVTSGIYDYMISDNGTLIYVPGSIGGNRKIVKIDMQGNVTSLDPSSHTYLEPQISPDNKKVAVVIGEDKDYDIWIFDIEKKSLSRLTFGGVNRSPKWSPDSKYIAFAHSKDEHYGIYIKPYDGSGNQTEVFASNNRLYADEWTEDGKYLIIDVLDGTNSRSNIHIIALKDNNKIRNFSKSGFDEYEASVSPNGKWIAYLTNESGAYQVYVRSFPTGQGKWQIPADNSEEPRWSPDGKTLYYRKGPQMFALPVSASTTFSFDTPKLLFGNFPSMNLDSGISYCLTSDGKYIITTSPVEGSTYKEIYIVLNWTNRLLSLNNGYK